MKVAIFSSASGSLWSLFTEIYRLKLLNKGIEISLVVLDEKTDGKSRRLRHAWNVASRQARVSGCLPTTALVRIVAYKILTRPGRIQPKPHSVPNDLEIALVPDLNSEAAINAVRSNGCHLICLMGTRILSGQTLRALGIPVINIHSGDPAFVRGGPPVLWEILDGRYTISLTIHEAVEQLDSGAVVAQVDHPIAFTGGLGRTVNATMESARQRVAELFFYVIGQYQRGSQEGREFTPGPLRVTPGVVEVLRADRICL